MALGTRIFLGTAVVLLIALGAAVAVTSVLGERVAVRDARERIGASGAVQAASQQQRFQSLGLLAEIMASRPEFKAYLDEAIRTGERASILDQLEERQPELGYDLAIVCDPNGVLVARNDQPEIAGVDLSGRPLLEQVRTEFEAAGVWAERGRLFEAVAVPMAVDQGLIGFLALGYEITDERALAVKRSTGSEVIFVAGPNAEAVATSLTPQETERALGALRAQGDLLARVTARGEEAVPAELVLGGERWLAQLAPLRDASRAAVGATIALASLDRVLEGYVGVRNTLLGVGGAALLVALLVSLLLARRVSKPIADLVAATTAAREGRYDVTIPPGGSGEVLTLATSFNLLLAELRERREMAEYVEKLARTLPEPQAAAARAPEEPAQKLEAALLAFELRRYLHARAGAAAEGTLERLSRDLRRAAAVVGAHRGKIEAVTGHRVLASFAGPNRSERALAATADLVGVLAEGNGAGSDGEPPAIAIASGELVSGSVSWGEAGARTLVGLPLQLVESLLREAGPGDILLAPSTHQELAGALARAGVAATPQRGLLATQPVVLLSAPDAARVAASIGMMLTHVTGLEGDAEARLTLTGIAPGSLLGSRFEILSVLGAGGMGVVYKARDRELDDLVALKMLKRDVAGDAALVARLKSELKLARKITHPNVLRTFDFGEIDGVPFISMEYVRGVTLRALLEESGRLPFAAALRLARQLLSGLAAAHALEILHRDIKPENVILDSGGSLKLMDFGLARPVTRLEAGQTREGWIVGTPHYLAPEQIEAREPDKRADVYACGVVLFELFTATLPFTGETPMEILMKHLKQEPPRPRDLAPDLPVALEALLLRALAKDAAARPADAGALLAALERAVA
jgi:serine/threonine-protein kinase